jgi:hypothetical protein
MDQTGGINRLVGFKILRRSIHKGHSHPAYHPSTLKIPSKIDPAGKSDKIYGCNLQLQKNKIAFLKHCKPACTMRGAFTTLFSAALIYSCKLFITFVTEDPNF